MSTRLRNGCVRRSIDAAILDSKDSDDSEDHHHEDSDLVASLKWPDVNGTLRLVNLIQYGTKVVTWSLDPNRAGDPEMVVDFGINSGHRRAVPVHTAFRFFNRTHVVYCRSLDDAMKDHAGIGTAASTVPCCPSNVQQCLTVVCV
jgi:hypothetical protein